MTDLAFAIGGDVAKIPGPLGVRLLARPQAQHGSGRGIDVQHMSVAVDDDGTVVDALQDREHGTVCFGKASEQSVALNGVFDDGLYLLVTCVVDAKIALCAASHRRNGAMFLLTNGNSNDRYLVQQLEYRWQTPAGALGDARRATAGRRDRSLT